MGETTTIQTATKVGVGAKRTLIQNSERDKAGAVNPAQPQAKPNNGKKVPAKAKVKAQAGVKR